MRAHLFLILVGIVGLNLIFQSNLNAENASYEDIVAKFEDAKGELDEPLEGLKAKYIKGLQSLQKSERQAGKLENIMAIRTEIEQLDKGVTKQVEGYGRFNRLQRIYVREKKKLEETRRLKTFSLASKQRKLLKELEVNLTKSNQLEEATAVHAERVKIEELIALTDKGVDPKSKAQESKNLMGSKQAKLKAYFVGRSWGSPYDSFTFNADGTGTKEWKNKKWDIKWEMSSDGVVRTEGGGPALLWTFKSKNSGQRKAENPKLSSENWKVSPK
ncbi:MAG: hypothetical protein L3J39_03235 [Verrucomicrobiales bacterium]|nr:hypothetical protein [Verrucomicrobiales bacterium]